MQPNGMIFWDWNGTLMDDVDFTHGCLNWMLESHGYPQRYDLAQYRELFRFPIEDYYRLAGFDFSRHPYPMLAEHFMAHYNAGVDACPVMAHAVDTLTELARRGWKQAVLSASRRDYLIEQVAARGLQGFFTELLGLADIYGVSKVQLGTDYLHRTGIDPEAQFQQVVDHGPERRHDFGGNLLLQPREIRRTPVDAVAQQVQVRPPVVAVDLDAGDEPDAPLPGQPGGLADAPHRVVVGQRKGVQPAGGAQTDDCGDGKLPVAAVSGMDVEVICGHNQ